LTGKKKPSLKTPGASSGPTQLTPRRYRAQQMLTVRPPQVRMDALNAPNPNPARDQIRFLQNTIDAAVYQAFEGMCASRVPDSMTKHCRGLLSLYRYVSEGLRFGDRSDQICARIKFCLPSAYLFKNPHTKKN